MQHVAKDVFSVCGDKSFIHCVCLLVAGNFNDPTLYKTLRLIVVLTEYSLIFHGVDC